MLESGRTRSFSVYLLKAEYNAETALIDDHSLGSPNRDGEVLPGSTLFVFDGRPREPWWKLYLGIQQELKQATKAALLFVPAGGRNFAICFGHVAHNLRDESYEYDFGLRLTLNCVDPLKLKNTDILEPGAARRQRTQVSVDSDITFFDFESDAKVLRSLTGAVKSEFSTLIKSVTGSSSLRLSTKTHSRDLTSLCTRLLEIYSRADFKDSFPDVQNVSPVRDPAIVGSLDEELLTALRLKSHDPLLTIPELVEYNDSFWIQFAGEGRSELHHDVHLALYYAYLDAHDFSYDSLDRDSLRRHKLVLLNDDMSTRASFAIFKSLIFDARLTGDSAIYHLMEGNWYKFESDYVARVTAALEPHLTTGQMPECADHLEADYNLNATESFSVAVCLDTANLSPRGQTQIEPCDVLFEDNNTAVFSHVKFSTASAQLSHLFNQGANAMLMLRSVDAVMPVLTKSIETRASDPAIAERLVGLVRDGAVRAHYAIVTHKSPSGGVANLPLFSRLSLSRAMRSFRAMGIKATFEFVPDMSPDRPGEPKPRKARDTPS